MFKNQTTVFETSTPCYNIRGSLQIWLTKIVAVMMFKREIICSFYYLRNSTISLKLPSYGSLSGSTVLSFFALLGSPLLIGGYQDLDFTLLCSHYALQLPNICGVGCLVFYGQCWICQLSLEHFLKCHLGGMRKLKSGDFTLFYFIFLWVLYHYLVLKVGEE